MSNKRYRDFDLFRRQQSAKREPLVVFLFGEECTLPSPLPASVMLSLLRMYAEGGEDQEINPAELVKMAQAVFGKANLEKWTTRDDFDMETMGEMLRWAMAIHGGADPDALQEPVASEDTVEGVSDPLAGTPSGS